METIYFIAFCLFIAAIIFWGLMNDDYDEFHEGNFARKFTLKKKQADVEKQDDDADDPKANLL